MFPPKRSKVNNNLKQYTMITLMTIAGLKATKTQVLKALFITLCLDAFFFLLSTNL